MDRPSWRAVLFGLLSCVPSCLGIVTITGPNGGVNPSTGERPFRRELGEFESSGAAFDLYIQALKQFQSENQGNQLSWFGVCGIHGRPYQPWDGVQGLQGVSPSSGYCEHNTVIFPPWHRPYLALFEQLLWNYAQSIANNYPASSRSTYQAAATTLRIPYWDWPHNATLPNSLTTPQITITTPSGVQLVDNPLFNYTFHPPVGGSPQFPDPVFQYSTTVRYPNSNGQSNNGQVQQVMNTNAAGLRSNIFSLLTSQSDYTTFSTDSLQNEPLDYNNLESIHNNVHTYTGGTGHMAYLDSAAFDPIFWLHHCNVDRLLAMWQALWPNSYVQPEPNPSGTFTEAAGTVDNVDSPLHPFHASASGTFWTPRTAQSTRQFGYTYPEIVDWGVSQQTLHDNVANSVQQLYAPIPSTLTSRRHLHRKTKRGVIGMIGSVLPANLYSVLGVNYLSKSWVINIALNRNGLGKPFKIHFFYGPPPADASQSDVAPNLIGTYSVLPTSSATTNGPISRGQLSLSPVLANALSVKLIENLEAAVVVPFLTENLRWIIRDYEGNVVDTQDVTARCSLFIKTASRDVNPPAGSGFPQYGPWVSYQTLAGDASGS